MRYLTLLIPLLMLCACGGIDAEQTLAQTEEAWALGDIDLVKDNCLMLADSTRVELTPAQKCRLALLYCRLYDREQDESYNIAAIRLVGSAAALDPGVAATYYDNLPPEDQSLMQTVRELSNVYDVPAQAAGYYEEEPGADDPAHNGHDDHGTE